MIDLNQYLYAPIKSKIPDLLNRNRMDILKSEFKFSNRNMKIHMQRYINFRIKINTND